DDVDLVGAQDVGEDASVPAENGSAEQQLAILALRLEMAGVYLRLASRECTCCAERSGPTHGDRERRSPS
ncbi:MAG: hypothetical protein K8R24_07935, partial [Mycobacterium sp.]|nr:hypothetical protein [Mycobacterium sp.]